MARKYLGAAASLVTHLTDKTYTDVGRNDGGMVWMTSGIHQVGVNMLTIPWVIPYSMQIQWLAYYVGTAGSSGSPLVELRKNGTAGGNTVSGTSGTPGTSPTALTGLTVNLVAGDLIYPYMTATNTTAGIGLAVAWRGVRT